MKFVVVMSILLVTINSVGCNIEVKQDTPQATIATMIKLYASPKQTARVTELVDPVVSRANARGEACIAEAIQVERCYPTITHNIYGEIHVATPAGCPAPPLSQCLCGDKGLSAAGAARGFLKESFHAGLMTMHMSPDTCSIADSRSLDEHSVAELNSSFWSNACSDLSKKDPIASVTIKCTSPDLSLTFILQNQTAKWKIVGFDTKDEAALMFMTDAKTQREANEQRSKDLNKDLK
jgi:hypothetical protein